MAKQSGVKSSENAKEVKKTAFVPPTSRVSKRLQLKKSGDVDVQNDKRKAEFECPVCSKLFSVYFSAIKHIEKRHESEKKTSDLKPVEVEICSACDKRIYGDQHVCGESSEDKPSESIQDTYSCLGCEQDFINIGLFNNHIAGAHSDSTEGVFFEKQQEFKVWKNNVETQVHMKYLSLSDIGTHYQCNYVSPKNSAHKTHLCPSTITTKQTPKGVIVRYYKKHYNHTCPEYKMPKRYENFATPYEVFDSLLKTDSEELYVKFSNLLKSITLEASNVDMKCLKKLYCAALEMESTLDNYKEQDDEHADKLYRDRLADDEDSREEEQELENKSMIDDQITKALEPRVSTRLKRKSGFTPNIIKKRKDDKTDIAKDNSKEMLSPKPTIMSPMNKSPSFNDTYKQFVDCTLKDSQKISPRKEIVKTKIGLFSPKKPSIKDDSENTETLNVKKRRSIKSSPTAPEVKLENVDYEIVEQENDCNILVLKI